MSATIELRGRLHGLARKIGKIGTEHIVFTITHHDLEAWNRLVAFAEQDVTIVLSEPSQPELPLDESSDAEEAEDPDPGNGSERPRRTKKEPKGRHAVRDAGAEA